MQFIPICLDCDHFKQGGTCLKYGTPPQAVIFKNEQCSQFTGDEQVDEESPDTKSQ